MFRRSESARERTLLRLLEDQQRMIHDLNDRLMHVLGATWQLPPPDEVFPVEPEPIREWTQTPEQEPTW